MKHLVFSIVIGAVLLGSGSSLQAQILNGSFSTGDFTDWTVVGGADGGAEVITPSTTLPPGVIAPTLPVGATAQALVQSTDPGSGISSVPVSTIDAALGTTLPPTTNDDFLFPVGSFPPDNGQAIYQTFSLTSEATLTFAYSYQTNDGYPFDSVGYVLDGTYTQLVTTPPYPETGANPNPTAYTNLSLSLGAGTHTLAFVAYNTDGPADSTSLYVTNIGTTQAPEPSEWALLLVGCAALVFVNRLRLRFSAI